ncbi:ribose-phosphate pyrophosphokinase [Pseudomonas phage Psa21]|uniref:Ribose-phosphate pyrophosphokinase n=1 Tax=Pseudomonas phage Psa21 TaxID=2530023 RepID=A0A481W4P2_9CAUD|nr:ribose-phosphate pyrophosphokinase [Pseudomonas phage Psa21]QBJ02829.1 ribose-phosphate pyrophosphokinase [Pseudomonas phage Psa21]
MIKIEATIPTGYGSTSTRSEVKMGKMPGGELHPTIPPHLACYPDYKLIADTRSAEDIMAILLTVDALRRQCATKNPRVSLEIGYVPYARQDRVCNPGESLSIAVFAGLINSLNLDEVIIVDPHSDVTPALINNVTIVTQTDVLKQTLIREHCAIYYRDVAIDPKEWILVAPDAGAVKKTEALVKEFGFKGIVYASKLRELSTGKIVKTSLDRVVYDGTTQPHESLADQKVLIVDDICDGGRTFLELAKVIQPYEPKQLDLFVTHGIFSQGQKELCKHFNRVMSSNTYRMDAITDFDNLEINDLLALTEIRFPYL